MPTVIYLGNRAAIEVGRDEDGTPTRTLMPEGKRCTIIRPPDDIPLGELFTTITAGSGVWANHSDGPPAWVAVDADDPAFKGALEIVLSQHFGGCEIREPDPDHQTSNADFIGGVA
jgi:hypothetical protein